MDDLESGLSRGSSDAQGDDPNEWVGTRLNPAMAAMWKAKFGTVPQGPSGHYNPHGMLAAQRCVAETRACVLLLENEECVVADVGGAPHRTYGLLGERGRYLMPPAHLGDRTRRGRIPDGAAEHVCSHRFEQCSCFTGTRRAWLMTHSAYYLDPIAIWEELRDPLCVDLLVVEHVFGDVFGGFYEEAQWSLRRDVVTMNVAGNGDPYIHPLPAWQSGWRGLGGEVLKAEVLFSLDGVTRVVRLHAATGHTGPAKALDWADVAADDNKSGPLQFSSAQRNAVADNAKFCTVTFDLDTVEKIGPILWSTAYFKGRAVQVTVPVNGVSMVANHVLNRPRTPELLTEVTHMMKNVWARSRVPPALRAQTLSAVIAMGFVSNLGNEIDVNHTMVSRFSWAMEAHSVLLRFGKVTIAWWRWLVFALVGFVAVFAVFEALDTDLEQRLAGALVAIVTLSSCWCCAWGSVRVARAYRNYMESGWVASYGDNDGPRAPLLGNGFTLQRNLPLPGSKFLKKAPALGSGFMSVGATREREAEPARVLVSGVILDGAVPNALASTQAAEICAVENRVLSVRDNPKPQALAKLSEAYRRDEFAAVKRAPIKLDTTSHESWLKKISATYPASYVQNMREQWHHNQGVESPVVATKSQIKVEKSAATVKIDSAKETKTRLIQPPEDVDKTMTGLVAWQLWERVRAAWNGITTKVMYCSGYSCDAIGERVDTFIEEQGGEGNVVAWSIDMANYDSTLCFELQQTAFAWYVFLGMANWLVSWFMRVRSRGKTPNGVSYMPTRVYWFDDEKDADKFVKIYRDAKLKIVSKTQDYEGKVLGEDIKTRVEVEDFQMTSGRMDTNLTDTVLLVAALLAVMPKIPYLLLVCGDDGFLMLRKQDIAIVDEIKCFCMDLGLKPTGTVSAKRSEWEFCSKLFWWGLDETGRPRTVLGSKPFRGIARMGVNTTLPGAANAAAAALAVRIDSGHVPFLGPFADRTKDLCAERRVRPTGKVEWSAIRGSKRFDPCPLNYIITQERYGLGRENEDEFKTILARLNAVPIVVGYEPAHAAVLVDEA